MAATQLLYLHLLRGDNATRESFALQVREVAEFLGIDPNWLMAVFFLECSMNPQAVNRISGASGLIQFMPTTARGLGTTVERIRTLTAEQQLPFVQAYYRPYRNRIKCFADLYLATFYPVALLRNWPDSRSFPAVVLRSNPGLDLNKDGTLTVGEFKAVQTRKVLRDLPTWYSSSRLNAFTPESAEEGVA